MRIASLLQFVRSSDELEMTATAYMILHYSSNLGAGADADR